MTRIPQLGNSSVPCPGSNKKGKSHEVPQWIVTFADMVGVLMGFFVLIVSFSQMNVYQYRQVVGSIQQAFGKHHKAKQFSGQPRRQRLGIDTISGEFRPIELNQKPTGGSSKIDSDIKSTMVHTGQTAVPLKMTEFPEFFKKEQAKGLMQVEATDKQMIIRLFEKGGFEPGSAVLTDELKDALEKVRHLLMRMPGYIQVSGHSDGTPIAWTPPYTSNWALSAARAAAVVDFLLMYERIPRVRFELLAFGDTKPLFGGDTPKEREKNRRVEIKLTNASS